LSASSTDKDSDNGASSSALSLESVADSGSSGDADVVFEDELISVPLLLFEDNLIFCFFGEKK
jgi:hypothetical protein